MGNAAQKQSGLNQEVKPQQIVPSSEPQPAVKLDDAISKNTNVMEDHSDIEDDVPRKEKKVSIRSSHGAPESTMLKRANRSTHSIRLGASQRRSSMFHRKVQLSTTSAMLGDSQATEEVEQVLSNALCLLHSVLNKQADTQKIQQSDLLNVILYLQKPRKFSARYSKQRFFRAETEHNLRQLLQQNESVGKYFLEYVMLDVGTLAEEGDAASLLASRSASGQYEQIKDNQRRQNRLSEHDHDEHGHGHSHGHSHEEQNEQFATLTLKDGSTSTYESNFQLQSQDSQESMDVFKRLKTRHAIQRKKTGVTLTFGQKVKRQIKTMFDGLNNLSREKLNLKSINTLCTKCEKEISDPYSEVSFEIGKLFNWEFDGFEMSQICNGVPLTMLGLYAMNKFDLFTQCNVSRTTFVSFINKIERLYLDSNPYHNNIRACDVLAAETLYD